MADVKATRILKDIDSRSWEHPGDRAALNALRKVPGFDEVLKAIFGFFGEKPIRLAFLANAVRVGPTQFPRVHRLKEEAYATLDSPADYPLYVQQSPLLNAFAYGMERPFIILNSATLELSDDELKFIIGHELGHVMSGHVLYNTMTRLLVQIVALGLPIVGLFGRAVLEALLYWQRQAELSCDRAGVLAVQDPDAGLRTMMRFAGGLSNEVNLADFIRQAEEYRDTGDAADQVFKVLNVLGTSHPFPVIRVAELRAWFEAGGYERILAGEYRRRGEPDAPYVEDLQEAASSAGSDARDVFGQAGDAAKRVVDSFRQGFNRKS
jgi:Zn-dependent protease with chaperone function